MFWTNWNQNQTVIWTNRFQTKLLDIKASQTKGAIETKSYGNKKCFEQNVVIKIKVWKNTVLKNSVWNK